MIAGDIRQVGIIGGGVVGLAAGGAGPVGGATGGWGARVDDPRGDQFSGEAVEESFDLAASGP